MKLMSENNQSQVAMAREVKMVTSDWARTLTNTLNTAAEGLLGHDMKQNLQADTRHGFSR